MARAALGGVHDPGGQFWKALEFVRRAGDRYDFAAMLTTRYPLDRINEAIQNMQAAKRSGDSDPRPEPHRGDIPLAPDPPIRPQSAARRRLAPRKANQRSRTQRGKASK